MKSILPIDKASGGLGGGKAKGLALLKKWGFAIPASYLVVDLHEEELEEMLSRYDVDMSWAVRSSASGEDGKEHSFAGQYETFLNLRGFEAIKDALISCFDSMGSARSLAYSRDMNAGVRAEKMFVVLQQMVNPISSGAIFTADPVSKRWDKVTCSLTRGVSDELMSGKVDGENFQLFKAAPLVPESSILDEEEFRRLLTQALEIEKRFGAPVDLEYAIDKEHNLWWLQLRPITGLDEVHLNELDDSPLYQTPLYTRGNIGEMMPGPVSPLTMSTFGRAIDWGLQRFYQESGAVDRIRPYNLFVHSYYNHLFLDLNSLYIIARKVLLASKDNVDYSILGRKVDSDPVEKDVSLLRGGVNFIKSYRFVNGAKKAEEQLRQMAEKLKLETSPRAVTCYEKIDERLQSLLDAYLYHYIASAQSGWYFTGILRAISKGKEPGARDNEIAAGLFTNISDIESAQVLVAVDKLAALLASAEDVVENFLKVPMEQAREYLLQTGPEEPRHAWQLFIERHGHRCVREAELWEREWASDPSPVIESLRMATDAKLHDKRAGRKVEPSIQDRKHELGLVARMALKLLLPKARKAVARRERTKGLAILVQHKFKRAYRNLARLMVTQGLLEDPDDVFFLTHEELGQLVGGKHQSLKATAIKRRKLYREMLSLEFDDLYFGIPYPLEHEQERVDVVELRGMPVSRGVAEGRVRLVRSWSDAAALERGEIMVARYTDVGWTPYYSIINGLVTEIGSPLSHGAVVAREYGLPAVVGMKQALSTLKNGQMVRLDAIEGRVVLLDTDPPDPC